MSTLGLGQGLCHVNYPLSQETMFLLTLSGAREVTRDQPAAAVEASRAGERGFAGVPSGPDLAPVPQAAVAGLCRRAAGVPGGLHPV